MDSNNRPPTQAPGILMGKEGTFFDKPAPTGPPIPKKRAIPPHLAKIVKFFEAIAADEGLLLDVCVDKAVSIVAENYEKRVVGIDMFGDQPSPAQFIGIAGPIAVELYKQVLLSIKDRADEYTQLVTEANEEIKLAQERRTPIILQP